MRIFCIVLFAALASASTVTQTAVSDPLAVSATAEFNQYGQYGPYLLDSYHFPYGTFTLNVPDVLNTPPQATIDVSLWMTGAPMDLPWYWEALGDYQTADGTDLVFYVKSDYIPEFIIPYSGPGTISLNWQPYVYINPDAPFGGPTTFTVSDSASVVLRANMTVDPLDTPEPCMFVPLLALIGFAAIGSNRIRSVQIPHPAIWERTSSRQ